MPGQALIGRPSSIPTTATNTTGPGRLRCSTGEPWEVECRLLRADGTYRWFLVRAEPLRDADGRIVRWFGTNTDINDLRMAQQQLRQAERELRATIDTIPAHIWSCLPDGTSDYFNRRRVEYTGPAIDFFDIVHPDDRADHDEKWDRSIRTGRPFDVENRLRRFDGTYRRFLGRAEPLRDEQGNIIKWFGTNTDIDDLRRTEEALQNAQAELAHVSRISTLGELTASITHEVNQPLAGIVTNARGIAAVAAPRAAEPRGSAAGRRTDHSRGPTCRRSGAPLASTGAQGGAGSATTQPERIGGRVTAADGAGSGPPSGSRSNCRWRREMPMVLADRVQLQQVLINLLINAIQAMVETTGRERVLAISSQATEAGDVMLVVRDSGPGIDPAAAHELFKAFVTTKTNGMGMGLSICKSIIEAHGGRIWADGGETPGELRGAVFRFICQCSRTGPDRMSRRMHLGFDISYCHMDGRWRMPHAWAGRAYPDMAMFEETARIAERGCLDMIFSGDGTGIPSTWRGSRDAAVQWGVSWPRLEMSPIMTAMSRVTQHLGFGVTYSTTFMHPYYLARLLNSLDHATGGRIAFNVITSTRRSDFDNYGFDEIMDHDARYDRMEEFIDVCRALWDSVEPDAMLWDYASGVVGDPAKVHTVEHAGRYLQNARSAEHAAIAAGAAGAAPGRRFGTRHSCRGLCRRHGVRCRHAAGSADPSARGARSGVGHAGPRSGDGRNHVAAAVGGGGDRAGGPCAARQIVDDDPAGRRWRLSVAQRRL